MRTSEFELFDEKERVWLTILEQILVELKSINRSVDIELREP
jgi:hypothetical protein